MKGNFLYWLKSYFGFSNKESRGFLFLLPFLTILIFIPSVLKYFRNLNAEEYRVHYQERIDSMRKAGIVLIPSPDPVFNVNDTIRNKEKKDAFENLNKIPLSEADSITLQIVPGIGAGFAGRIIKYRERLGGFHDSSQLLEVYGLKPETVDEIWNYFEFDPLISRKIEINKSNETELSKHPYISYSEAKVLMAYKKQHGDFKSIDDLKEIKIFKVEWINKIEPYLAF